MLLGLLLSLYVGPFAVLLAAAVAFYWALVWHFFAGRKTAIAISLAVSVLSIPMIIAGHGIGIAPLVLAILSSQSMFFGWSLVSMPFTGGITYWLLGRVWVNTVYEPKTSDEEEPIRPWQL